MTNQRFALAVVFATVAIVGAGAFQGTGKKGYIIAQVDVTNPQQYAEYTKLTPGLIEKAGGRFIARGGRTATLEGPAARSSDGLAGRDGMALLDGRTCPRPRDEC